MSPPRSKLPPARQKSAKRPAPPKRGHTARPSARAPRPVLPTPPRRELPVSVRPEELETLPREQSLLDVVDNLLNKGVVISGDAVLGVADVDLVYLKLSALLCAADKLVV